MPKYVHIQQAPIIDSITDEGHVGAKTPWPVVADEEGTVYTPSSKLMKRVLGFQKDIARQHVDLWWAEAFAHPEKALHMYLVFIDTDGTMCNGLSAVDTAVYLETPGPLPVD